MILELRIYEWVLFKWFIEMGYKNIYCIVIWIMVLFKFCIYIMCNLYILELLLFVGD